MPDVMLGSVPAKEAIEHIRGKLRIPTKRWDWLMGDVHAKAFTVAGAMKMDLLGDLHESITSALENGTTLAAFRKDFDRIVAQHGWEYRGNRGFRTKVMFNTNLRTAHMAGRWKQVQRVKEQRPYMIYMTVGDQQVRPEHSNWHSIVLPVDDPWWNTHYPPNGWGCRCYVNTANDRQLKRRGLTPDKSPPIKTTERVNSRTGEYFGQVPVGIDPGWNYNVGKAWVGQDLAFGKKLMAMPKTIRTAALNNNGSHIKELGKSWANWVTNRNGQKAQGYLHTVGYLPNKVIDSLATKGIQPINAALVVSDNETAKLLALKGKSKQIPPRWLLNLPAELTKYDAVVRRDNELFFILRQSTGTKTTRAVITVNIDDGQDAITSIQDISVRKIKSLKAKKYELLSGEI